MSISYEPPCPQCKWERGEHDPSCPVLGHRSAETHDDAQPPAGKSNAEIAEIMRGLGPWGAWAIAYIEKLERASRLHFEQAMRNGESAQRWHARCGELEAEIRDGILRRNGYKVTQ